MEKFDNIIIGTGIAGLICGGYLAKAGQKTLLVDKMNRVGGRIRNFVKGDYTVQDQGPTCMTAWDGGSWPTAARELGADIQFTLYPQPATYVLGSHKIDVIPICYTASSLTRYILSQSPGPVPETTREEFRKVFHEMLNTPYKQLCEEYGLVLLSDWVEARTSDPAVHTFFRNTAANMVMMEAERAWRTLSAGDVMANLRMWFCGDGALAITHPDPLNGLAIPFADVFKSFGGDIRLSHQVTEVMMDGNKAVGVIMKKMAGGEEERIYAERVIVSAAFTDIPKFFKKLPQELEEPIRQSRDLVPLMDYYLVTGLKRKVTDIPSYVMVIDPTTGDNLGGTDPKSLYMPWSAPEGKHLFLFVKIFTVEQGKKLNHQEVYAECNKICEEMYPGFKEAIEWQDHTAHYPPLWQHQYLAAKIPQKPASTENLYFIGDGTTPMYGGGIDGPASTGKICAKRILESER
jgi:phytoene dehydrogenase-like protein